MTSLLQLTAEEKDQLAELLNIGVAHAGTTLSKLVGQRTTISVPTSSLKTSVSAAYFIDQPQDITLAVLLRISGGLDGYVFLLFPRDTAVHLLHSLSGKKVGDLRALDAFDRSVFQEVGNVLTGGMLQGLEKFLHCSLHHSVPNVVVDMGGAIFNSLTASMLARHEEFFSLNVTICVNPLPDATDCHLGEEVTGSMYLFLGPDAVKEILTLTSKIVS
jgi:chemotaxis protein CheY-P-specific phosphatase CheC